MFFEINDGKIVGRYANQQEGKTLLAESHASVKAALKAESDALIAKQAKETAYSYARARAQAYVHAFSKDPNQNAIDALGHVVDAILSHIAGDSTDLAVIQTNRAQIKQANPKA